MNVYQKSVCDCLQCCLSTMLNIPYGEIPEFYKLYALDPENNLVFRKAYDLWLKSKGYFRIAFDCRNDILKHPEFKSINFPYISFDTCFCIGYFKKPDVENSHAMVLKYENSQLFVSHNPAVIGQDFYTLEDLISIEFIFS